MSSTATITLWNGQVHPAANRYPMMPDDKIDNLATDIAANGLKFELVVDLDGFLLDGRHRLEACRRAGVEPRFRVEEGDPEAFVVSANEERRHLTAIEQVRLRRERVHQLAATGMSTREIAKEVGVTHTTVASDLEVESRFTVQGSETDHQGNADERPATRASNGKAYYTPEQIEQRRQKVAALRVEGMTQRAIADALGVHVSCVVHDCKMLGLASKNLKPKVLVDRWQRVSELAAGSSTAPQIAAEVGLTEAGLRAGCKQRGIEIAADAVMRKKRRTDSTEIIERVTANAGVSPTTLELIDYSALDPDPDTLQRWLESLQVAIRSLNTIKRNLEGLKR